MGINDDGRFRLQLQIFVIPGDLLSPVAELKLCEPRPMMTIRGFLIWSIQ